MASLEERRARRSGLNKPESTTSQSKTSLEARRARRQGGTTVSPVQGTETPNAFMRGLYGSSGAILSGNGLSAEEMAAYQQASQDQGFFSGLAEAAGGLVGDIPGAIAGALGGGAAGAALSGPAAPIGGAIGAGAGAFGLPSAIRGAYNEYIQLSSLPEYAGMSMEEVALKIAKEGVVEGGKGAVTGALTALVPELAILKKIPGVDKLLGTRVGSAVAKGLSKPAGKAAAELAVLTTVPAALEGRLPTTGEFATNAVLLGGFKAAASIPSIGAKLNRLLRKGEKIEDVLERMPPEEKAKLEGLPQSEFNETLSKFLDKSEEQAQKIREQGEEVAKKNLEELDRKTEKKLDKSETIPEPLLKAAEKGLNKQDKLFSAKEASEIRTEERRIDRLVDAVHDFELDKQHYEDKLESKIKAIKAEKKSIGKQIAEVANLKKQSIVDQYQATQKAVNTGAKGIRSLRDSAMTLADATSTKGLNIALSERASSTNKANQQTKTFAKKAIQEVNKTKEKAIKAVDDTTRIADTAAHKEFDTTIQKASRELVKLANKSVQATEKLGKQRIPKVDLQGKPIFKSSPSIAKFATHARAATRAFEAYSRVAKKIQATYEAQAKKIISSTEASIARLSKAIPTHRFAFDKTPEKFNKLTEKAQAALTKASDKEIRKLSKATDTEASLERQIKTIEDKAQRDLKAAAEKADKDLKSAQADLDANLLKIQSTLDYVTNKANELKDSRLQGINEKYKSELSEALAKLKEDMTSRRAAYEAEVAKWKEARLAKLQEKNQRIIDRHKVQADALIKTAEERVKFARDTGYFEIEARRLDPTAEPGVMIKKRLTYRRPQDKGKTSEQVVESRIVDRPARRTGTGRSVVATVFDKTADLKKINPESFAKNPGVLLEQIKTAWSKVRSIVEDGVFDYNTFEVTNEGFSNILQKHFGDKPVDLKKLDAHLAAQTSIERQNLGQKNPIPTQDALNLINSQSPYSKAAKDLSKMMHAYLDRQVQSGMVSVEGATKMKEMYGLYAPLLRAIEPDQAAFYQSKSLLPKQTIKKAVGSERDIISPSASILENITAGEFSIAKNDMARELGHYYMKEQLAKPEVVKEQPLSKEDLQKLMGDDMVVNEETAKLLNQFRSTQDVGAVPGGFIHWFENGKKYRIKVDAATHEIVSGASKLELGMAEKAVEKAKGYFSASVTLFPTDIIRLGIMDWLQSGIQTKFPLLKHISALPRAIGDAFFRTGTYRDWIRSGKFGMDDVISQGDFKYASETFSNAIKKGDNSAKAWLNSSWDLITAPLRFLQDVSSRIGDAPRLAEYNNTIKQAKKEAKKLGLPYDPREAAYRAAQNSFEVTTTYGREGASKSIQMLNRLVPFARTIITSTQSFAKAIDPRTAQGRAGILRAGAALALPTLYFYLKNRGDPRYQALTQEQKDNYLWVYTTNDPNEEPIKLRKFWQFGWLFQTLPEHLAEFAISQDPKALNGLMRAFEFEFSPATILNISESFHKGGVIIDPNKLFEGRYSTVPRRLENLDPEFQETESTTETAKLLGHKLGVLSPVWWDHAAQMFGAKFGKAAMGAIDDLLISAGVAPDSKMAKQLTDDVLFGSFYGRGPGKSTAYLDKFYDIFNEHDARYKTYKRLSEQGRDKEAEDYIARKPFLDNKSLQKMRQNIIGLVKQIREVEGRVNEKSSDRLEKRKEWLQLVNDLTSLAKEYSEELDGALKELGQSSS